MIKSYLRSLYRNIIRNKFYAVFNVVGLATGLTATLLILFYIQDELSYDKHYKNHDRIYRLESAVTVNNNVDSYATFPVPLGPALKNEIPEIEQITRLHFDDERLFAFGEKKFFESSFCYADSSVFSVFSHEFLRGNPDRCLTEPGSIVLTESVALRYFGDADPMGMMMEDSEGEAYRVTGIVRDLPSNTHLRYDALISMSTHPEIYSITKPSRYWRVILYTYVLINEKASIDILQEKFQDFYVREMEPLGKQFNVSFEMKTTPLTDTHFKQGLISEQPNGNKQYLVIFLAIAVFILIIASINYMNMATARSANRSKEVGVRKVLGADKGQLIQQFLSESLSLSLVALFLSVLLVWLFMGNFNEFTGKQIQYNPLDNGLVFLLIFLVAVVVGLLSGSYPAFYLSSFQPAVVLKGHLSSAGKGSRNLRRILVTLQFFLAVFMVISSMVVANQLKFLKEKDLGYEQNNMLVVQAGESSFGNNINSFCNEIRQSATVQSVTNSSGIPGLLRWIQSMKIEEEEGMNERAILYLQTDFDFCKTYGIQITQGRDFDKAMGTDSLEAVLINETAAYEFGWTLDPLGKKIHYGYGQDGSGGRMLKVIGVMKDFNLMSLHNAIEPVIIFIQEDAGDLLSIRIGEENKEETIAFIEKKWMDFGAKQPFRFEYMKDRRDETYLRDEKTGAIIKTGTFFTIILALLGLLGLSSFVAEQRTREVGIRKIHGASLAEILYILYKDFIGLFLIAYVIAVPIAWWRLNIWLETEFVYFQEIGWITLVFAGVFSILTGILTISFFIFRSALGNPIDAIKYE